MESATGTGKRRAVAICDGDDGNVDQRPAGKRPRTNYVRENGGDQRGTSGTRAGTRGTAAAATSSSPSETKPSLNGGTDSRGVMNGGGPAVKSEGGDESKPLPPDEAISSSSAAPAGTAAPAAATSAPASAASARNLPSASGQETSEPIRWRSHRIAEDYIGMASTLILPTIDLGPFGYDASSGHYPTERVTALGLLTSPLRRPTVVERWNPYEICVFEASMALYGKDFHEVARTIGTKNCKDVVEFYYVWKKTDHYKVWKKQYTPHLESDSEED